MFRLFFEVHGLVFFFCEVHGLGFLKGFGLRDFRPRLKARISEVIVARFLQGLPNLPTKASS